MGAILNSSHENPLLPEFQYFRFYDLSHVGGIWKLFMKKQHSFGYNMDSKLFAQVIGATPASVVGDVQQARDDEKQLSIINSNNNSNGFNNEDYVDGGRRSPTLKIPDSETLYTLFLGRSGMFIACHFISCHIVSSFSFVMKLYSCIQLFHHFSEPFCFFLFAKTKSLHLHLASVSMKLVLWTYYYVIYSCVVFVHAFILLI
jgi:hypothetical protein